MNNDPELNGKFLGGISSDFVKVADMLKEASYLLRQRDISKYPIFPMAETGIKVGKLLLGAGESADLENKWNYYISFMGEFMETGLIAPEGEEVFKSNYRDPDEYCCLFVVHPEFTNFVFIPYPED